MHIYDFLGAEFFLCVIPKERYLPLHFEKQIYGNSTKSVNNSADNINVSSSKDFTEKENQEIDVSKDKKVKKNKKNSKNKNEQSDRDENEEEEEDKSENDDDEDDDEEEDDEEETEEGSVQRQKENEVDNYKGQQPPQQSQQQQPILYPIHPHSHLPATTLSEPNMKLKLKLRAPSCDLRLQWVSWINATMVNSD